MNSYKGGFSKKGKTWNLYSHVKSHIKNNIKFYEENKEDTEVVKFLLVSDGKMLMEDSLNEVIARKEQIKSSIESTRKKYEIERLEKRLKDLKES